MRASDESRRREALIIVIVVVMKLDLILKLMTNNLFVHILCGRQVNFLSKTASRGRVAVDGISLWTLSALLHKPIEMSRAQNFRYCLYHGQFRRRRIHKVASEFCFEC